MSKPQTKETITYIEYRSMLINVLLLSINAAEENAYLRDLRNAMIETIQSINTALLDEQRTGVITISAMCLERET